MHWSLLAIYWRSLLYNWILKNSCICVSWIYHKNTAKMIRNGFFCCFWPFLCWYYVKSMKYRCQKILAFSFITIISYILRKEINSSCINTSTQITADFTKIAYAIPLNESLNRKILMSATPIKIKKLSETV